MSLKKILIDLYKSKTPYSGLGQFSIQFANYIAEHYAHEFEFHFLVPRNHKFDFPPIIKIKKVNPLLRWWKSSHEQYDLWHSLHQFPSYQPPSGFKQLLTIHDLNFLYEKDDDKKSKYLDRLTNDVGLADHITTISEFTKGQVLSNISNTVKPIDVVYNGLDHLPDLQPTRPSYTRGHKFFFSISLFSAKKNFEVLLPMMKMFPDVKLIIAGDHDNNYGKFIKLKINELGLSDQIILPGKIPKSEKIYLYQFCEAFLFPSLAEGFGLPPIEAMQFGKPVFLSKHTSLPEVGGAEAYYFDNFEPDHMANTIQSGLKEYEINPFENAKPIMEQAARFTWEASMEKYIALYRELT